MKSRIILFVLALIVWLLLNWVPDMQHVIVGVFIAAFVAFITGDMFVQRPYVFKHVERYLWFLYYVPLFLWECIKANIDVAYRVAHPDVPVRPGIVKVNTSLKSDTALTFLANSITLTPGTLSVDIDKEKGLIYVHWINVKTSDKEDATRIIVHRFEKILKRIFD